MRFKFVTERGAVWLAHLNGVQGVSGSNPLAPISLTPRTLLTAMTDKNGQNNSEKKKYWASEKRAVPRLKREVMVQYAIKELPHTAGLQVSFRPFIDVTRTKDLSENGIFFNAARAIPAQSIVEIKLQLPIQKEAVELEARVVGCEEVTRNLIYGIRAEFIKLNTEQKRTLRKFMKLFLKG